MEFEVRVDCKGVNWETVSAILKNVGMAHYAPEIHKQAFESSYCVVFIYENNQLIAFGRAISDGVYQAALYDFAVLPAFQGKRLGALIMETLLSKIAHCNIILYASPGKEGFYKKQGFRKMKTGMAKFIKEASMYERGFTE